jgi:hypothetical protein
LAAVAAAADIAHVRKEMPTKEQLPRPSLSMERQLRETKTEIRLADLEEKVFGHSKHPKHLPL